MKRLVAAALVFGLIVAPAGLQAAEKAPAKPVKKTVVPGAKAPAFSVLNARGKVVKVPRRTSKPKRTYTPDTKQTLITSAFAPKRK